MIKKMFVSLGVIVVFSILVMLILSIIDDSISCSYGAEIPTTKEVGKSFFSEKEYNTIKKAANRNNCFDDNFIILLAIRKSENGGPGKELGIMNKAAYNLDKQAAWAACTIIKNRDRWNKTDKKIDFITFLGSKYCPTVGKNLNSDEKRLNKYWVKNVKTWYNKIKG